MKIIMMNVEDLIPYVNNPRNNAKAIDKVASSIKNFGFKVPIVVDKNKEIITGHTRLLASKKLELKKVPCIIADDLTETQIKAYRIADNKTAEFSEWDEELLNIELASLKELEMDLDITGFDATEIEKLFDKSSDDAKDDGFEIQDELDKIKKAKSKRGQIFQLGRHRLMCGDSTSIEEVEELMYGEKADLLLTDPPYNVAYEGKTKDSLTIQNDQMNNASFRKFLVDAFKSADNVMKNGAVFYIWHADSEGYNFRGACFDIDWQVRQCLIWNKNTMVMGRQDYHWKHEPCLYGWKKGASHLWATDRKQTTILNFDRPSRNAEHPTMKPIPLFDYQIKNNTKGDDIVLDLFGGSGTTIMACEQNGRSARVMELDEKYVDVIIKRWEEFTGGKAEILRG